MKVFDYSCPGLDCQKEFLDKLVTDAEEEQYCDQCNRLLVKLMPNPVGFVRGTRTPCKNTYK